MFEANCPHCGQVLRCDPAHAGKQAACPRCKRRFTLPAPPPPRDAILEALPAKPPVADVVEEAEPVFNLEGAWQTRVDSEIGAQAALTVWKADMPETPSAYKPSGTLPPTALLLMALGALLGAVLGAGAEAVVGSVTVLLVWLVALLNAVIAFCGFIWFFLVFVLLIIAVVAIVAPFAAGGWAASGTTTLLGRWGNNRNSKAAGLLSALSAVLSVLLLWWLFQAFVCEPLDARRPFDFAPETLHILYVVVAVVGGLVAPATAAWLAVDSVRESKFCESCGHFMKAQGTRMLRLGGLQAITRHLKSGDLEEAAHTLGAPDGSDGEVRLFRCPQCGRGYVEATAHFKATWKEKKDEKEKTEDWRVASVELTAEQAERFQELCRDRGR